MYQQLLILAKFVGVVWKCDQRSVELMGLLVELSSVRQLLLKSFLLHQLKSDLMKLGVDGENAKSCKVTEWILNICIKLFNVFILPELSSDL